jgi:DHA1 family bicyclomycin/chloramphenicol resistance-like MFS transporter
MTSSRASIGFGEFVTLTAILMAIQAIAIDAMLPALPAISQEMLSPGDNRVQWVVTAYVLGMGTGQLIWGSLSDHFGRRPVLICGLTVYGIAALACALTRNFEMLLVARLVNGLAAACAVVVRSVIRDLYSGRSMARVMSLTFIVFMIIPILAPTLGQGILLIWPWRAIFILFAVFSTVSMVWALVRLPETLPVERRQSLAARHLVAAAGIALGNRISLGYTLGVAVTFGSVLAYVAMAPQIFGTVFGHLGWLPGMFALCAIAMSVASYLNSRLVERLGMRFISHSALLAAIAVALLHWLLVLEGYERLWTFVLFQALAMGCFGLMVSNFGAMAMEPVGAVAGAGASLQGFVTTSGAALIGAVIGKSFDNSTLPFTIGVLCCGVACLVFVLAAEEWKLFKPHAGPPHGTPAEGAHV